MSTKKLKQIRVEFISLVKRGANKKDIMLKSSDIKEFNLVKTDDEMQRVYGVVYAPDELDAHNEFTDRDEILKAADNFMKDGRTKNIDLSHSFVPDGAFVAESWIVRKDDPMFKNEKEGSWAVGIQVESDKLWEDLKKGKYQGISMGGTATKESTEPSWLNKIISKIGDNKMSKELEQIIKEFKDNLTEFKRQTTEEFKGLKDEAIEVFKQIKDGVDDKKMGDIIKKFVGEEISKAKAENMEGLIKVLAEALANGRSETIDKKKNIYDEMV